MISKPRAGPRMFHGARGGGKVSRYNMGEYLIGVDAGTTGCKTCVFTLDGHIKGDDYREYPSYYPNPGWVEQIPEDLVPAVFASCKAALGNSGVKPGDILALAISTQGSVVGLLDARGKLIRPFIGWQDLRGSTDGTDYLLSRIPREKVYDIAGDPVGTVFTNTKFAWVKLHEPDNWRKTAMFSTHQDYFLREFGADGYYTDLSSASRDGLLDIDRAVWSEELHEALGIPLNKRPAVLTGPGEVICRIPQAVAEKTGLLAGTPLCLGAHDQNCSTFGAGGVSHGAAVLVMGTFGSCFVVTDKSVRDPNRKLVVKNNHGVGNYTIEAFSNTAASSYRWYRDTFCDYEKAEGKRLGEDPYDLVGAQIEAAGPGANGVTFLPYLQGASGVRLNSRARGAFTGMTLGTSKGEMARAVMEGICYEMYDIIRAEIDAGVEIDAIRLSGGAAKSKLWRQMMSDIFKRPIMRLSTSETGCLGAALYAGVGACVYRGCADAALRAVHITETNEPDHSRAAAYDEAYDRFSRVYDALESREY